MCENTKTSANNGANNGGGGSIQRRKIRLKVRRKNTEKTEVLTVSKTSTNSREILVTENGLSMPFGVECKKITYRKHHKMLFVLIFESAQITLSRSQFVAFLGLVNRFKNDAK